MEKEMQVQVLEKVTKNQRSFLEIMRELYKVLSMFNQNKDAAPTKIKSAKLLIIYYQVIFLIQEAEKSTKNEFDQEFIEKIKVKIPNVYALQSLFIAMERPRLSTEELANFNPTTRGFLTRIRTEKEIYEKRTQYVKALKQIIDCVKNAYIS